MQLQSHADDDLYVAVLDLTDRFRCHAAVPTVKLGAGRPLALNDGDPLPATLPAGVPVEPGQSVRDWLKVIVSTVDFEATSFTMQQLDARRLRSAGPAAARRSIAWRRGRCAATSGPPWTPHDRRRSPSGRRRRSSSRSASPTAC